MHYSFEIQDCLEICFYINNFLNIVDKKIETQCHTMALIISDMQ